MWPQETVPSYAARWCSSRPKAAATRLPPAPRAWCTQSRQESGHGDHDPQLGYPQPCRRLSPGSGARGHSCARRHRDARRHVGWPARCCQRRRSAARRRPVAGAGAGTGTGTGIGIGIGIGQVLRRSATRERPRRFPVHHCGQGSRRRQPVHGDLQPEQGPASAQRRAAYQSPADRAGLDPPAARGRSRSGRSLRPASRRDCSGAASVVRAGRHRQRRHDRRRSAGLPRRWAGVLAHPAPGRSHPQAQARPRQGAGQGRTGTATGTPGRVGHRNTAMGRPSGQHTGPAPAKPVTRPAKPSAKPAGRPRQVRAMRLTVLAMTVPILFGLISATGELARHGYGFFVFRSAGTGATQQGPSGPAPSQPSAAHHPHRIGSGLADP